MTIDRKRFIKIKKLLGNVSLPDVLESIREDLELSKTDMAKKLKVSKSYYGDFTNGRTVSFSVKKAAQWAKILGYPEQLFVKYALDDLLQRNELSFTVEIKKASNN